MSSISSFAGSIPANYDHYLGPILFEPYALDLAQRLQSEKINNLLELACGTGRVTRHLVKLIEEGGRLVATDLNPAMIAQAQKNLRNEKIEWKIANAEDLDFENEEFDHIVCQFGVMFFPDKEKSFREANRVLKTGGKYLFNTWESVENNPRIDLMWKVIYEVFGDRSPDFFQKGPHSFYDKNEIEQLLLDAGFKTVRIDSVAKTSYYKEPGDLINGFADGSPLANYLKEKEEGLQKQFRELITQKMKQQDEILGNTVPCLALVIEAEK